MIEPYISERQCSTCRLCKSMSCFGRNAKWPDGISRRCTECDRKSGMASRAKRRLLHPPKPVLGSRTAWALPVDDRPEEIKALDMALRDFRLCEPAANLTWILGDVA